jgi:hypothetical protein
MDNRIGPESFDQGVLAKFAQLDDVDILSAIKAWQHQEDIVLASLCQRIVHRKLLNIKLRSRPIPKAKLEKQRDRIKLRYGLDDADSEYFVFEGTIENKAYDPADQNIHILRGNGKLIDVAKASDQLNLKALSKTVTKYYICYPKDK